MNKQKQEDLSALVDGEIAQPDAMISQLQDDPELRQQWHRYHLVRDAMTDHLDPQFSLDISSSVSQALENEPTILAPKKRTPKIQKFYKQASGFAIAATVATVAVLSVQQTQLSDSNTGSQLASNAIAGKPQAVVKLVSVNDQERQRLNSAVESKLNSYLVNHNEYSLTSKMQGALPYMRIVSVTPGKRIKVKPANEE